jgi:hypothetical protein
VRAVPTIEKSLQQLTKEELYQTAIILHDPAKPWAAEQTKSTLIKDILESLNDKSSFYAIDINLGQSGIDALMPFMCQEKIANEQFDDDSELEYALVILRKFGLAYPYAKHWAICPELWEHLSTLSEEERDTITFADILYSFMFGTLCLYGIISVQDLCTLFSNSDVYNQIRTDDADEEENNSFLRAFLLKFFFTYENTRFFDQTAYLFHPEITTSTEDEDDFQEDFYNGLKESSSLSYAHFSSDTILHASQNITTALPCFENALQWLKQKKISDIDSQDALYQLYDNFQFDPESALSYMLDDIHYSKPLTPKEEKMFDTLLRNIPIWQFKGHTLTEVFAQDSKPDAPKPKVGRNDPCPCGSGKKYKNCCGGIQ